jgi:DNA-binding beta-propeller fold protein YncE
VNATLAYVGSGTSTVDVCAIGPSGGLSSCASTGSGFNGAAGITLYGGDAYVANQGGASVTACTVGSSGDLIPCASFAVGASEPMSVAFNGSQAYVDDLDGFIYLCTVESDGTFSSCSDVTDGNSFYYGINIAIH